MGVYENYLAAVEKGGNVPAGDIVPDPFREISDPRNNIAPPYAKSGRRFSTTANPTPPLPVGGQNPNMFQDLYNYYQRKNFELEQEEFQGNAPGFIDTSQASDPKAGGTYPFSFFNREQAPTEGQVAAWLRQMGKGDVVDEQFLGIEK